MKARIAAAAAITFFAGMAWASHTPPSNEVIVYDGTVGTGSPATGAVGFTSPNDHYDWFCAKAVAGQQITITATRQTGTLRLNVGVAEAFAAPGQTINEIGGLDGHTSNSSSSDVVFNYTPTSNGTITIMVSTWNADAGGDYTLTVTGAGASSACGEVVPNIAYFFNSTYSGTSVNCFEEGYTTRTTLADLGYTRNDFSGITAADFTAALAGRNTLYFPELEKRNLAGDLDAAAITAIRDFVNSGGSLATNWGSYNVNLLNALFGFSVSQIGAGTSTLNSANAAGTTFEGGPATLPSHSATLSLSSLPTGSVIMYDGSSGGMTVGLIPFGAGKILFIGWDWFNGSSACPTGDANWQGVLDRGLRAGVVMQQPEDIDYGDAPDSYATLVASTGPSHMLDSDAGLYLGACVDSEADAQTPLNTTGDDVTAGDTTLGTCAVANDDEDGVDLGSGLNIGQTESITVTASASGLVDAFIDFNNDGVFTLPGEQVLTNAAVVAGPNTLDISTPDTASPGTRVARFRVSTAGSLSFDGPADDGEVEDYLVTLIPNADLSITVVDNPDPVVAAQGMTYTVTVSNAGPNDAVSVAVSSVLALQFTFVSTTGCAEDPNGVPACSLGTIASGGSAQFTIDVTAQPAEATAVPFSASASTSTADPNGGNNSAKEGTDIILLPGTGCNGLLATIIGTDDGEKLEGTDGNDIIQGNGGDDNIDGRLGDDVICGGPGRDNIKGGDGRDMLFGDEGDDRLNGENGDDELDGGPGDDRLNGDDGDDVLLGGEGNDKLDGGKGEDDLQGEAGMDDLNGNKDPDILDGGPDADKLNGGDAVDECLGDRSGPDQFKNCELGSRT